MQDLGTRLADIRKNKGLSRRDVAKALNIPYQTMCNYEYGRNVPKPEVIQKIAELYGCSIDEIYGKEKSAPVDPEAPVTMEEVYAVLERMGFVKEGRDLSDEDFEFLSHVIGLISSHFS